MHHVHACMHVEHDVRRCWWKYDGKPASDDEVQQKLADAFVRRRLGSAIGGRGLDQLRGQDSSLAANI